jgi:hypothetical protein|tara:strand:+ start:183 stop:416 length:234 start_codon:yes stop_codon:yes gene_type:complete
MEEDKKSYRFLGDCANVVDILKTNPSLSKSVITINVPTRDFPELLSEIESFVRVRVDKSQKQVSLSISGTEFIFIKS